MDEKQPLQYAQPALHSVSDARFPAWISVIMGLAVLASGAMLLAVFHVDRLGWVTWVMVGSGALGIYAVMGCLSRDIPAFGRALMVLILALLLAATSVVMNWRHADTLEAEIVAGRTGTVIVYIETEKGGRWATLLLAWRTAAMTAALQLAVSIYVLVRIVRIRSVMHA